MNFINVQDKIYLLVLSLTKNKNKQMKLKMRILRRIVRILDCSKKHIVSRLYEQMTYSIMKYHTSLRPSNNKIIKLVNISNSLRFYKRHIILFNKKLF